MISSYCQDSPNQAQDSKEIVDDTKQTIEKVPPKQDSEKQSQKNDNGRLGDTDDTLHTNGEANYYSYCEISEVVKKY
jgi:hypothetical protein